MYWDKARSSNTIGIISAQSASSFQTTIGDYQLTNALLQNFRQKICFKTEDTETLQLLNRLVGHASIMKKSYTSTRSGKNSTSSTTETEQKEAVVSSQLMRELRPNECVALLSMAEHNMDDVLTTTPVGIE